MPDPAVHDGQQPTLPPDDRAGVRFGLFVGGLVVALLAGFALGKVLGDPVGPAAGAQPGAAAGGSPMPGMTTGAQGDGHTHGPPAGVGSDVGGLSLSAAGYTLVPTATSFRPGTRQLSFTIKGPDGEPATDFAIVHEKPLHLIIARRDLTGFQHLHPTMSPDGTWSTPVRFDKPGLWRAFADFTVLTTATATGTATGTASASPGAGAGGQTALTLGTDLTVAGDYQPEPLAPPARHAEVAGYTVTYAGTPATGATQPLLVRVSAGGRPQQLEPYLGAYGHLVVLREGDLGYVHVHPEARLVGDAAKFWLAAPSPGRYRMFLDFQVAGKVHTATFTLVVP